MGMSEYTGRTVTLAMSLLLVACASQKDSNWNMYDYRGAAGAYQDNDSSYTPPKNYQCMNGNNDIFCE